jgi:hypothetical protein
MMCCGGYMSSECSLDELLNFLALAGERELLPVATVQALAVATRKVFAALDDTERARPPLHDLEPIIRRFQKVRAEDLNPSSLTEYERRVRRAAELYLQWTHDPARFNLPTRATSRSTRRRRHGERAGASRQDTAVPTTERSLPLQSANAARHTGVCGCVRNHAPCASRARGAAVEPARRSESGRGGAAGAVRPIAGGGIGARSARNAGDPLPQPQLTRRRSRA